MWFASRIGTAAPNRGIDRSPDPPFESSFPLRTALVVSLLAPIALAGTACTQTKPKPVLEAPPELAASASGAPLEAPPPAPAEPMPTIVEIPAPGSAARKPKSEADDGTPQTVFVIEEGGEESRRRSLVEAAREARKARAADDRPVRVRINNDNLHEFQDGNVTFAGVPNEDSSETVEDASDDGQSQAENGEKTEAGIQDGSDEQYWRERVLRVRQLWKLATEEAARHAQEAAALRDRFYQEDDDFVRDGEIKPQWDRSIELQREAAAAATRHRTDLDAVLTEGHQAGALAGWLDEGIELEPIADENRGDDSDEESEQTDTRGYLEAQDPQIHDIGDADPP